MARSISLFALAAAAILLTGAVQAQPATKPIPRMADGKPDLNGAWDNGGGIGFLHPQTAADGSICVTGCKTPASTAPAGPRPPPPKPDFPAYKAEFLAKVKDLSLRQVAEDPVLRCRNPGLPRIGPPDKIVQTSREFVFLYDDVSGAFWRIVPINKPHRADAEESYLGDGVAHWEGDVLVVESVKFNADSWLIDNGAFHTKDMKVIERFRRAGDLIEYQATVDDPGVLSESWRMRPRVLQLAKTDLLEPAPCVDQDLSKLVDPTAPDGHHDNPR